MVKIMKTMSVLAVVSLLILVLAFIKPGLIASMPSLFQFIIGFIAIFSIFYAIAKRHTFVNIMGGFITGKKLLHIMKVIKDVTKEETKDIL